MNYKLSAQKAHQHYLTIDIEIKTKNRETTTLLLPNWRPGRYELGKFAKNIINFIIIPIINLRC